MHHKLTSTLIALPLLCLLILAGLWFTVAEPPSTSFAAESAAFEP